MWRIELFGGIRLIHGCHIVTRFRTQKTGSLLGLLAHGSGNHFPREQIVETFWGDDPREHARMSLSVALTHLRGILEPPGIDRGDVLMTDRMSVMLSDQAVVVDTKEFTSRVKDACCCLNRCRRLPLLVAAVEQYRPEILSGYSGEWVLEAQARLNDQYCTAVAHLARDLTAEGELEEAARILARAIQVDPLREAFHRQAIRVHVGMGNPGAAVRQYNQMASILRSELQVEPSAADQQMIEAIRGGLVPGQTHERVGSRRFAPATY